MRTTGFVLPDAGDATALPALAARAAAATLIAETAASAARRTRLARVVFMFPHSSVPQLEPSLVLRSQS